MYIVPRYWKTQAHMDAHAAVLASVDEDIVSMRNLLMSGDMKTMSVEDCVAAIVEGAVTPIVYFPTINALSLITLRDTHYNKISGSGARGTTAAELVSSWSAMRGRNEYASVTDNYWASSVVPINMTKAEFQDFEGSYQDVTWDLDEWTVTLSCVRPFVQDGNLNAVGHIVGFKRTPKHIHWGVMELAERTYPRDLTGDVVNRAGAKHAFMHAIDLNPMLRSTFLDRVYARYLTKADSDLHSDILATRSVIEPELENLWPGDWVITPIVWGFDTYSKTTAGNTRIMVAAGLTHDGWTHRNVSLNKYVSYPAGTEVPLGNGIILKHSLFADAYGYHLLDHVAEAPAYVWTSHDHPVIDPALYRLKASLGWSSDAGATWTLPSTVEFLDSGVAPPLTRNPDNKPTYDPNAAFTGGATDQELMDASALEVNGLDIQSTYSSVVSGPCSLKMRAYVLERIRDLVE